MLSEDRAPVPSLAGAVAHSLCSARGGRPGWGTAYQVPPAGLAREREREMQIIQMKPGEKVEITVPESGKKGYIIKYSDYAPVLITREEILDELRQLL